MRVGMMGMRVSRVGFDGGREWMVDWDVRGIFFSVFVFPLFLCLLLCEGENRLGGWGMSANSPKVMRMRRRSRGGGFDNAVSSM